MSITDAQVEAAARAIHKVHDPRTLDGVPIRFEGWRASTPDAYRKDARAALEAAERTAWRPIETAPKDATMLLAATADGRLMIWRGDILDRNLKGPTPNHLSFPATHWRPLPDLPSPPEEG